MCKDRRKRVITYQAPGTGSTKNICRACERKVLGRWPKDHLGQEYCQVSQGLHEGTCDICGEEEEPCTSTS